MKSTGSFTLPGEAGYEQLTLEMAKRWGADVIRDSDGTKLSDELLQAGYVSYSTICLIREHNEWAKQHENQLQQTFLVTNPQIAVEESLQISLMEDFFADQFRINESEDSRMFWQVYDRTSETLVEDWTYDNKTQSVTLHTTTPWHSYTVSFLVFRIWEEISMYNHTTNNWDKEHLMQIDPMHEETKEYLRNWMKHWCEEHPETNVVRFTSMFYNFVWIWGSSEKNRHLFSDWASYDFTVSPLALRKFEAKYGYALTAEDFINQGKFQVTHMPATKQKRDWMEFINDFVIEFGKELIDIVHDYKKQAYVFYDDSWVGVEPYNERFEEFGFDGIIKCVFSGYEARMCAGVKADTHEIRLHPYLFPVGLGGAPTFMEGGNPTLDAKKYWKSLRRALLREPVDRIGLGGYLHLVEGFPDFVDYMEQVADEFRTLKEYHSAGAPETVGVRVAVLHYWGKLRSWTLSGHMHETYMHDLIHINESLAGLPVEVEYINFEDVKHGCLEKFDVVINAGCMGNAWSGGDAWNDVTVIELITKWVSKGGMLLGVNEPTATKGYQTTFRLSHILGVDYDLGERVCHGKWSFEMETVDGLLVEGAEIHGKQGVYLTDGKARVLASENGIPTVTVNEFGAGMGIYLSSYNESLANTRFLLNLLLYGTKQSLHGENITSDYRTECAVYKKSNTLVVFNNSEKEVETSVVIDGVSYMSKLPAFESEVFAIKEKVV